MVKVAAKLLSVTENQCASGILQCTLMDEMRQKRIKNEQEKQKQNKEQNNTEKNKTKQTKNKTKQNKTKRKNKTNINANLFLIYSHILVVSSLIQ